MNNMQIIRPQKEHLEGILECLRSYHFHVLGEKDCLDEDFSEAAICQVRNRISHVRLEEKCWIAVHEGKVIGFCTWAWIDQVKGEAKTRLITVLPEARSLGAGFLLQSKRMEEMRSQSARLLHTWSDDPNAIAWYQKKFGYVEIGRDPIFHAFHRFTLGDWEVFGIHRAFPQSKDLAHLLLEL